MERKDFFKKLITIGGGTILSFIGLNNVLETETKNYSNNFKLMSTNIAGLRYYQGIENLHIIKEGEEVELRREPMNIHDAKAVAIYWRRMKIGFIPRHHNAAVASLMDSNIPISANISHINPNESDWHKIYIRIKINNPIL